VAFNKSVSIIVKPKITRTSESLMSYDPNVWELTVISHFFIYIISLWISRRQCYFDGERQLKFFQIYTKANCELECLTNSTMRYCNCSAFFMPSKQSWN
jgi:amiloride-sensitive sodium channel